MILVCKCYPDIERKLIKRNLVVEIDYLPDLAIIRRGFNQRNNVHRVVFRDEYASLETIELSPEWNGANLLLYINRLGQFRNVYHKVQLARELGITIIFTSTSAQACRDAQILSSLGVHTGIELKHDSVLTDEVLDLITYTFYSTAPHAPIEPFATLSQYYSGDNYVAPTLQWFVNPLQYLHINQDLQVAFSNYDLNNGIFLDSPLTELSQEQLTDAADKFNHRWQKMFYEPHHCTFCPAFRICQGFFCKDDKPESDRCATVMSELLEAIEFHKKKNQKNTPQAYANHNF
ncbi:MAG: hypothetical protein ACI4AM_05035 [Muribaculaceae bacterium]